ncbi:MAG: ATPase [Rhodobacteraceae bacterium]|nr:ATPase [Paracoccaceae bacterium]
MNAPARLAHPAPPRSLDEVGLHPVMMRDLLLKTVFRRALSCVSEIAAALSLPIPLTQELLDMARAQKLLEATGSISPTSSGEMGYQLTEMGRARAIDALSQSEYYGAMPVPLEAFRAQVRRQSVRSLHITPAMLEGAMQHLILPDGFLAALGPAVASGRSILLYGPPGNGKSSISNGIRDALGDTIFVPHAISYAGQVITMFDPVVHTPVPCEETHSNPLRRGGGMHDPRYVQCRRPTVITGGELTLDMLDLNYNATARTYQASLQLKAAGGVFIVDDLGRQAESPQALINRWIVPMEAGYDILSLQSGEKFEVPFDTLVIFSTNFHPNAMFDDAALRRIFFKIKIDGPSREQFLRIFALVAKAKGVPLDEAALVHLMKRKYPEVENRFANFHGPFLIDQMKAVCAWRGEPPHMSPELVDLAWANLFVSGD